MSRIALKILFDAVDDPEAIFPPSSSPARLNHQRQEVRNARVQIAHIDAKVAHIDAEVTRESGSNVGISLCKPASTSDTLASTSEAFSAETNLDAAETQRWPTGLLSSTYGSKADTEERREHARRMRKVLDDFCWVPAHMKIWLEPLDARKIMTGYLDITEEESVWNMGPWKGKGKELTSCDYLQIEGDLLERLLVEINDNEETLSNAPTLRESAHVAHELRPSTPMPIATEDLGAYLFVPSEARREYVPQRITRPKPATPSLRTWTQPISKVTEPRLRTDVLFRAIDRLPWGLFRRKDGKSDVSAMPQDLVKQANPLVFQSIIAKLKAPDRKRFEHARQRGREWICDFDEAMMEQAVKGKMMCKRPKKGKMAQKLNTPWAWVPDKFEESLEGDAMDLFCHNTWEVGDETSKTVEEQRLTLRACLKRAFNRSSSLPPTSDGGENALPQIVMSDDHEQGSQTKRPRLSSPDRSSVHLLESTSLLEGEDSSRPMPTQVGTARPLADRLRDRNSPRPTQVQSQTIPSSPLVDVMKSLAANSPRQTQTLPTSSAAADESRDAVAVEVSAKALTPPIVDLTEDSSDRSGSSTISSSEGGLQEMDPASGMDEFINYSPDDLRRMTSSAEQGGTGLQQTVDDDEGPDPTSDATLPATEGQQPSSGEPDAYDAAILQWDPQGREATPTLMPWDQDEVMYSRPSSGSAAVRRQEMREV